MTLLEELIASKNKPAGECTLTGSGVVLFLRRWSLDDRLQTLALIRNKDEDETERQAKILAISLVDAQNKRLFGDDDLAVVKGLELGADVERIIEAALKANGYGVDADEKKASSTDTLKN